MNLLDKFIAYFAPETAVKRESWRQALEEYRSYDAGNYARLNSGWRVTNQPAELEDRASRDVVRARARDLERNSDIANAVTRAYRRNVIGSGWALQANTGKASLNDDVEKLWRLWCKARNCDVTGQQSLNQILRMASDRKRIDGGILFVKRYTSDGVVPFQLQMLEVDDLDQMTLSPHNEGNRVIGGIELNSYNKPQGYWIRQYAPDGYTPANPVYIEAKDVIFYFAKRRPSQVREFSDLAPSMTRIRDTQEYMTAVSVKERINACLSVFIKKQLPPSGYGRGSALDNARKHEYDGKMLTPGMISELNAGDEVQVVNPTGQSADATTFIKAQERLIGSGQGLSYEATTRDMGDTNYSAARQGAIEDELSYEEDEEQILDILDEIYRTFFISAVLAGKIDPGKRFWDNVDTFVDHTWIKAPKRWIDPLKETSATKTALMTGQKTFKQIAAENGRDWKQQIDDMAEVMEYGKQKGINMGGVIFDGKVETQEEETETSGEEAGAQGAAASGPGSGSAGQGDSSGS